MTLKLVKKNETPKWKRVRPGLYKTEGGQIERGAETGMWYMVKFNPKSGRTLEVIQHITLQGAKEAFDR